MITEWIRLAFPHTLKPQKKCKKVQKSTIIVTPSTIPAGATLDDGVTPSDNIYWDKPVSSLSIEGGYYGSWMATPLIIKPEIRLYLPIQYQGKTIEYNVTFSKITNVIKP